MLQLQKQSIVVQDEQKAKFLSSKIIDKKYNFDSYNGFFPD